MGGWVLTEPVATMIASAVISSVVPSAFLTESLPGASKLGFAVDLRDLVCLEQASDTAGQLFGDGILMGDDLGEVDRDTVHLHADVLALMLDVLNQLCAVQQALGGDAAHVQAGAAQVLLFHDGDLCAQLSQTGWQPHSRQGRRR